MKFQEIVDVFEKHGVKKGEFAYNDISDNIVASIEAEVGPWTEIDQHGGSDEGPTWWTVKYFSKHDVYIKLSGYYSSYNGTDFDEYDYQEVKPTEKTITIYE